MSSSLTRGPMRGFVLIALCAALGLLGGCEGEPTRVPLPRPGSTSARAEVATPSPMPSTTPAPTSSPRVTATTTPLAAGIRPRGAPSRVVVRTQRGGRLVDAKVVPTGLDHSGVLAPPPGLVGWYNEPGWPEPGFPGASILAGHINTRRNGPDTFARLPEVRRGAVISVRYSSGDEVEFVVSKSAAVPKQQTPKDDSIWDAGNPRPLLRLITCDPTTPVRGGHYVGNWVVWAVTRT